MTHTKCALQVFTDSKVRFFRIFSYRKWHNFYSNRPKLIAASGSTTRYATTAEVYFFLITRTKRNALITKQPLLRVCSLPLRRHIWAASHLLTSAFSECLGNIFRGADPGSLKSFRILLLTLAESRSKKKAAPSLHSSSIRGMACP